MQHKRWITLAILPAVLLVGDFYYWRLAVNQLRLEFEAWVAGAHGLGWDVGYSAVAIGGWPAVASLKVENVTIVTDSTILGRRGAVLGGQFIKKANWGARTLLLRTGLTQPKVLEITPIGLYPLRLNNDVPIPVSAGHLHIRLTRSVNASPRALELDAVAFVASLPGLGQMSIEHLDGRADLRPDGSRNQPVITFSASARQVSLPDDVHWGLGSEVNEATIEGALNGSWSAERLTEGQSLTSRAVSWRDGGGSLELHKMTLSWGPTQLEATATFALDEDLQPMGVGNGKIVGYGVALDALAANAVLTRSAAKAAKSVMSLTASSGQTDQPEEVEVPLTLQFRTLSVRQVPLMRLPEFDWAAH